jgi:hypothetical protein
VGLEAAVAREQGPGVVFASTGDNVGYFDGPTSSALVRRLIALGVRSCLGNHEAWLDDSGRLAIQTEGDGGRHLDPDAFAWSRGLPLRLRVTFHGEALRVTIVQALLLRESPPEWEYVTTPYHLEGLLEAESADLVIVGHSHGPMIHTVPRDRSLPIESARLPLEQDGDLARPIAPGARLVVDAGSLGRPGHHPAPRQVGMSSYAVVDLERREVRVRAFRKG